MKAQQDNLNGSMEAFARAFSNLVKDSTSHLATKDDLDRMRANMATKDDINRLSDELEQVKVTVSEGYRRIYSWKDDMYKTFARKEDLRPSAFKEGR